MLIVPGYCPSCNKPTTRDDYYDAGNQKQYPPELRSKLTPCKDCKNGHKKEWDKKNRKRINLRKRAHNKTEVGKKQNRQRNYKNAYFRRQKTLEKTYHITDKEYDVMFQSQGGLCAICGNSETVLNPTTNVPRRLCTDHNHETGKVRELLCLKCNLLIGRYNDNIQFFEQVVSYLKRNQ